MAIFNSKSPTILFVTLNFGIYTLKTINCKQKLANNGFKKWLPA